ncbi:hypothetical protein TrRE_jg4968 [Triparma retinervis]|uniref:Tyrosine specific protein phosphatases domain-containing protein n=1 Tax=Triparma retinervis TaxID=2557542 RepID=A0A9W6ZHW5_9STRA|nr:hypothetical protein TrRE_jg4968 [Triparma retinervis]
MTTKTTIDVVALVTTLRSLPWDDKDKGELSVAKREINDLAHLIAPKVQHTEDYLLAALSHPHNIARRAIEEATSEDEDIRAELVKALKNRTLEDIDDTVRKWREGRGRVREEVAEEVIIGKAKGGKKEVATIDLPGFDDPELGKKVRGPTKNSNWLIPGAVMVGSLPGGWYGGGMSEDLTELLQAGVTTFVSLIEDEPPYRDCLKELVGRLGMGAVRSLSFPIDDFDVEDDRRTQLLVERLSGLVFDGEVVYVHCLSGRGRTGTIAIPLLMGLVPRLGVEEAAEVANLFKRKGRRGETRGGHMPEMRTQMDQIVGGEVEYKRGGWKGKHKGSQS